MEKEYEIVVTQEDIDSGVRENSYCCPIALACIRLINPRKVNVEPAYLTLHIGNEQLDYRLPLEAMNFIEDFDCERIVTPLSFIISFDESQGGREIMSKKNTPNWETKTAAMIDTMTMDDIRHRIEELNQKTLFERIEIAMLEKEIGKRDKKEMKLSDIGEPYYEEFCKTCNAIRIHNLSMTTGIMCCVVCGTIREK